MCRTAGRLQADQLYLQTLGSAAQIKLQRFKHREQKQKQNKNITSETKRISATNENGQGTICTVKQSEAARTRTWRARRGEGRAEAEGEGTERRDQTNAIYPNKNSSRILNWKQSNSFERAEAPGRLLVSVHV